MTFAGRGFTEPQVHISVSATELIIRVECAAHADSWVDLRIPREELANALAGIDAVRAASTATPPDSGG